jgi:ketol-acid reductoisomerase
VWGIVEQRIRILLIKVSVIKFVNIWMAEQTNKNNRFRQTEEMRGTLKLQKLGKREQRKLEQINKSNYTPINNKII